MNSGAYLYMGFWGCSPEPLGYKGPPAPSEDNRQYCELKKKNLKFKKFQSL